MASETLAKIDRAARWYGDACAVVQEHASLTTLDARGLGRVVTS